MHHGETEAAIDAHITEKHRARAALAVIAPLLASRQLETFPEQFQLSLPAASHLSHSGV